MVARRVFEARGQKLSRNAILVDGGVAWVGLPPSDLDHAISAYGSKIGNNSPFQQVFVPAFALDERPVTRGEFLRFILSIAAFAPASPRMSSLEFWKWFDKHVQYDDDLPIVGLSYDEAAFFAWWHGGRLPWVYEYEVAACGTEGTEVHRKISEIQTTRIADNCSIGEGILQLFNFLTERNPRDPWVSPFGLQQLVGWVDEWVQGAYFDPAMKVTRATADSFPGSSIGSQFPSWYWEYELMKSSNVKRVSALEKYPHPGIRSTSEREPWFDSGFRRSLTTGFRCAYSL